MVCVSAVELLGLLGLFLQNMLLIGSVDVDIIGLFALVRLLRFVALMLVDLFRRWLLELSCGSAARVVGSSAHIAAAGILTNIILEIRLAARGVHLIVGHDALVWSNLIIIVIDLFTLHMPRCIVLLLRALGQVLGRLLNGHWVLFDVEGRYFRLLVPWLVLYVFIFEVLDAVFILFLIIFFNVQVVVVSNILMVSLWLLLWDLDLLDGVQIFINLLFLQWFVCDTFNDTLFIFQWRC